MARQSRRAEIIATAERLFSEKGYLSTTVAEIAAKIGAVKGSVYVHFPRKEDILLEIVQQPMKRVIHKLEKIKDSDLPWPEKVRRAILEQFNDEEVPHFTAIFMSVSELYTKGRERNEVIFNVLKRHKEVWIDILQEGIDSGYSDGSISAKLAYFALVGMCQWAYKWYSDKGPLTAKQIGEQFAKLFLEGFGSSRPAGKG